MNGCGVLHRWTRVKDTGVHWYMVCQECGKRKVLRMQDEGYQPVDRKWIETGEWANPDNIKLPNIGSRPF